VIFHLMGENSYGFLIFSVVGFTWYALKFAFNAPVKFPSVGAVLSKSSINIACLAVGLGTLVSANACSARVRECLSALVAVAMMSLLVDLFRITDEHVHVVRPGTVACAVATMYTLGASLEDRSVCASAAAIESIVLLGLMASRAAILLPKGETNIA
jgi:hypothetical protein